MMSIKRFLVLGFLQIAQQVAAQPTPANFTHLQQLSPLDPNAVVVTARLPQWVYSVAQPQLQDLRVFNSEGIAVAHQLMPLRAFHDAQQFIVKAIPLTNTEVPENAAGHPEANVYLSAQGNLTLHINSPTSKAAAAPIIKQWLLNDDRLAESVITEFDFELDTPVPRHFEADVSLDTSEDLRNWNSVSSRQKLLFIRDKSNPVQQLKISVPPTRARYWRVRSDTDNLRPIGRVRATTPAMSSEVMETREFPCRLDNTRDLVVCTISGNLLPLTAVNFDFGQQPVAFYGLVKTFGADTVRPLEIQSTIMLAHQANGLRLSGQPVSTVELSSLTGWQLGLHAPPLLRVQWPARQLEFLAHGAAPFQLAAGAPKLAEARPPHIDPSLTQTTAVLGTMITQQAEPIHERLDKPSDAKAKPWVLWLVLAAAVLMLVSMALSLLKDSRSAPR